MFEFLHQDHSIEKSKNRVKIWREQIKLVEENALLSNIFSFLLVLLLARMLWPQADQWWLMIWFGAMALIAVVNVVLTMLERRYLENDRRHPLLSRWVLTSILLTAAGWGCGAWLLFPTQSPELQLLMGLVLVGVVAVSVPVISPILSLYYAYTGLMLVPLILRFVLLGENYYPPAVATLLLWLTMLVAGARVNKSIMSGLDLRFHNDALIRFLSQAKNASEDINEELTLEIERRRRVEKELSESKEIAEAASKTKSEFLANMSHEIRTPMNGILGTLQLLRDTPMDDERREYISIAYNSGEALLSLLNDILDFSKIEAGKMTLEHIPFDLAQVIKELRVLLKNKADERGVNLVGEIDERLPKAINGDPVRIRQILANLMTNAIKFTEKGEVRVNVKVLEQEEKMVRLRMEVADTGIGISDEAQRKLFNAFTQADGSTTRKYGGTGLGLVIVRKLTTLMHGSLGMNSELGKGSCFWIEMAFDVSHGVQQEQQSQTQLAAADVNLHGHVLLVEDNPVNQVVAKKMLEKIGLTFEVAKNGREANERLQQPHTFNLVLMDCHMPVMDGYVATSEIRKREQASAATHLTVIAMTANAMEGDREKCIAAGMDDYVSKPVRLSELKTVLQKWL